MVRSVNRGAARRTRGWSLAGIASTFLGSALLLWWGAGDDKPGRREVRPVARDPTAELTGAPRRDGRGRAADTPSDIPAPGWKDILLRVYGEIQKDRVLAVAAGVTFYALLAIFPAVLATVSIYGFFADAGSINDHLRSLSGILPSGAIDIVGDQIKRIVSKGTQTLGFAFIIGLVVALWSSNAGMKAIFDALNIVYEEEEKRGFLKLSAISFCFTIGGIVFVLAALGGIVVLPIMFNFVGLGGVAETVISLSRWPALLVVVGLLLALLYRFGPSRDHAKWRWVTWGSAFAAIVWLVGSMLFSWYVSSFGNYNETYGSLGAAIGFMTWIWLSTTVVLVGGELNAEMERQTARDTTAGSDQAMGSRGARMADQVA